MRGDAEGARGSARLRERLTRAIEVAVIDELAEIGYGRFSVASVARRAGIGKAAIYRRWATKDDMLAELLASKAVVLAAGPDTGSLPGDLRAFVAASRQALGLPRVASIVADLFAESLRNPDLAAKLHEDVVAPRRSLVTGILQRALARQEIPPGLDVEAALDLLPGAFLVQMFTTGGTGDEAWAEHLTAMLLRAVGYPGDRDDGRTGDGDLDRGRVQDSPRAW